MFFIEKMSGRIPDIPSRRRFVFHEKFVFVRSPFTSGFTRKATICFFTRTRLVMFVAADDSSPSDPTVLVRNWLVRVGRDSNTIRSRCTFPLRPVGVSAITITRHGIYIRNGSAYINDGNHGRAREKVPGAPENVESVSRGGGHTERKPSRPRTTLEADGPRAWVI